jgi:hypothetical protein
MMQRTTVRLASRFLVGVASANIARRMNDVSTAGPYSSASSLWMTMPFSVCYCQHAARTLISEPYMKQQGQQGGEDQQQSPSPYHVREPKGEKSAASTSSNQFNPVDESSSKKSQAAPQQQSQAAKSEGDVDQKMKMSHHDDHTFKPAEQHHKGAEDRTLHTINPAGETSNHGMANKQAQSGKPQTAAGSDKSPHEKKADDKKEAKSAVDKQAESKAVPEGVKMNDNGTTPDKADKKNPSEKPAGQQTKEAKSGQQEEAKKEASPPKASEMKKEPEAKKQQQETNADDRNIETGLDANKKFKVDHDGKSDNRNLPETKGLKDEKEMPFDLNPMETTERKQAQQQEKK